MFGHIKNIEIKDDGFAIITYADIIEAFLAQMYLNKYKLPKYNASLNVQMIQIPLPLNEQQKIFNDVNKSAGVPNSKDTDAASKPNLSGGAISCNIDGMSPI